MLTSVEGGDPGYDETSKMVAEAALLMATRREELPMHRREGGGVGGIVTPAFAFGWPLIDVLGERGLRFTQHGAAGGEGAQSTSHGRSPLGLGPSSSAVGGTARAGALMREMADRGAPAHACQPCRPELTPVTLTAETK